ncbi:DNA (cytosine-5-)-methyltransferase [Romboutsia sp. MSSM.1001216sp_RTP31141st1_G3_RTP31141_220114]|uniref:DNA cytosine methyltransferase n=1 Tax=unclassified Romboutsia TaxID=2626894 RepID=UPI0031B585AC
MTRVFNDNINFIDLFAGMGGFHIALTKYNANCVFVSEIDKYARETYIHNHIQNIENTDILYGDITKIPEEDIPQHDILCAGFPCQPFSISGNQLGFDDARGTMFFEIIRIINLHQPSIVFLENVSNLRGHANGNTLETMSQMLEQSGYKVFYEILNASDFGVPQARKRIYFVAFHNRLNVRTFEFPRGIREETHLADILEDESLVDESYHINRNDIVFKTEEEITKLESTVKNQPIRIGTINRGGQGDRIYSIKGHAITLSAQGGGSGSRTGAYLVNGHVRKLTPRECLRVQGYPEEFEFPNSITKSQVYKQLGNTVAIPVLEGILRKICSLEELRDMTIDSNTDRRDTIVYENNTNEINTFEQIAFDLMR